MMGRLGGIFTGVQMIVVLLTTASPNLAKQFQVIVLMSVFASLLPYIYALVALPIIMVAKSMNKGGGFIFYCTLAVIGILYSLFALFGSGGNAMFWGVLMMMLTIPLYALVAAKRSKSGIKTLYLDSEE